MKVIGIDLGTTNSLVAFLENNKEVKIIPNYEGFSSTPSIVGFNKDETLVGQVAKRQAITNSKNTVFSIKRFMGMKYNECEEEIKRVSYKIVESKNGDAAIEINGKQYSPQEISSKILQKLKKAAEDYLGESVKDCVITVPAYFNNAQRESTSDAAKIAGLNVLRIVSEPTAAAIAYGIDKKNDETIAVVDLGGGTFDVSILEISDGVIQVLSTNGDTHLGGDDIDARVVKFLIEQFKKDHGIDLSNDSMALQRLTDAAEKAKIELSSVSETEINLPFLTADASGPKHLLVKLNRAQFERMIRDIVEKIIEPCKIALKDAKKSIENINEIVLVGGSTRIPLVQQIIRDIFNKEPNKSINPDEAVAIGAALQASVLAGDNNSLLLLDVTPLSLGIETLGGVMTVLIPKNTTIPVRKSEIFSTAADNQSAVDIHVLQGERKMSRDNRTLGKFKLDGLIPAPRGMPKIEVSFDIDANGIVKVSAIDKATGKEQDITITSSGGLDEKDIERMVKEAAENEESDKLKKEETDNLNNLDSMVYNCEKMVNENRDKLGDIESLNEAIEFGKVSLTKRENIKEALDKLTKASHKAAEVLYRNSNCEASA